MVIHNGFHAASIVVVQSRIVAALAALCTVSTAQQTVTIHRDGNGVPHVFATSDPGAFYGAGYAMAEDRLFQMCWARIRYQGRMAEFFGAGNAANPTENTDHDLSSRALGWARTAQSEYQQLEVEDQDLLQHFAAGVNDYVASSNPTIQPLFATYGVPVPSGVNQWQPWDCLGVYYQFMANYEGLGLDEAETRRDYDYWVSQNWTRQQMIEEVSGENMMDNDAASILPGDVSSTLLAQMQSFKDTYGISDDVTCPLGVYTPTFSEAIAVAGSKTNTQKSVLVGLPRVGVKFPNSFCELHMVGRSFNVRGACIPGAPFVISGATMNVAGTVGRCAWSPTKLDLDQTDLFKLKVDPAQFPNQYKLDGVWTNWLVDSPETIWVKDMATGQLSQVASPNYRMSYWGPVVTGAVDALPGEEYALCGPPFTTTDRSVLEAFLAMYRAAATPGFDAALEKWIFPSVNLVFAGPNGTIGYEAVGMIPVRKANTFLQGYYALDGFSTANKWQGEVPHALRPKVLNPSRGFVYNGNSLPIGSWYPMKGLIPGSGDTNRSRIARDLLTRQTTFTESYLAGLVIDTEAAYARDLTFLGDQLQQGGHVFSADATSALTALKVWRTNGSHMDSAHGGEVAVAAYASQTQPKGVSTAIDNLIPIYGGRPAGMSLWLREIIRGLTVGRPLSLDDIDGIEYHLSQAWAKFTNASRLLWQNNPSWLQQPSLWTAWYEETHLQGTLQLWRTIDGFGPLETGSIHYGWKLSPPHAPMVCTAIGTLAGQTGSSFNQFVPLRNPDESQTLLALGQSEHFHPNGVSSPYAMDQLPLWEQGGLKPSPMQLTTLQAQGITSTVVLPVP